MVARSGLIGLLAGVLTITLLVIPMISGIFIPWAGILAALIVFTFGGYIAGRLSGSVEPLRSAALGGLAGGLAGVLVFCCIGAALAGITGMMNSGEKFNAVALTIRLTCQVFLMCFGLGLAFGFLGGWMAHPHWDRQADVFVPSQPQMALNGAITAVLSSLIAVIFMLIIFSRLENWFGESILDWPLGTSLFFVLTSQFSLILVVPHEIRLAKHRCGLDEVKMAAYVGISTAPILVITFLLLDKVLFLKPAVSIALLVSVGLSFISLHSLLNHILPKRANLPAPQDDRQKIQAALFGSIADSQTPSLMILCIGCGVVMVLPFQVILFSVLINIISLTSNPGLLQSGSSKAFWNLFSSHGIVTFGLIAVAITSLMVLYLFYLKLGVWFRKRLILTRRLKRLP